MDMLRALCIMQSEMTQWNKSTSSFVYSQKIALLKDIKYYKQLMGMMVCLEHKNCHGLRIFIGPERTWKMTLAVDN
jgi:hypothetical protein